MKGDKIPDNNHIARFCDNKHVVDNHIQATAFQLRRSNEKSLSVNWLESLNCSNREIEIDEIRNVLSQKLTIGTRAMIAVLNVGETCLKVLTETEDNRNLEVLHDPEDTPVSDSSHSGIYNLRYNDHPFISELILETVLKSYPAR